MLRRFERFIDPFPADCNRVFPRHLPTFLWECISGARCVLVVLTTCTAILGVLEAWLYSLLARLVDSLTAPPVGAGLQRVASSVWIDIGVILAATTLLVALQAGLKYQAVSGNLVTRVRWRLHRRIMGMPLGCLLNELAGRLSATVMQCAVSVRIVWVVMADILVFVAVFFSTLIALAGAANPLLALPFAAWLLLYVLCLRFFIRRLGQAGHAAASARNRLSGVIADAYGHAALLQMFSSTEREMRYARKAMGALLKQARVQLRWISRFEIANSLLSALLIASTAGVGLWLWQQGRASPGAVAATLAIAIRLHGLAHFVMGQVMTLTENLAIVQDAAATLEGTSAPPSHARQSFAAEAGSLEFKNLHFSYGPGLRILRGVSLHVAAGEHVAIVGETGAGKSTLAQLLVGLSQPDMGQVLIDGQDVSSISPERLRTHISVVTQETSLLNRSVFENIALGCPHAGRAAVEAASWYAGADEFIRDLEDSSGRRGYDYRVGDRGLTLSGGQRQRIAIARALVRNPRILIMDEPTSALDPLTESLVLERLRAWTSGRTVLHISHRLSTLKSMDRIVVMHKGRIAEEGTHAQLLAREGIYARLWQTGKRFASIIRTADEHPANHLATETARGEEA